MIALAGAALLLFALAAGLSWYLGNLRTSLGETPGSETHGGGTASTAPARHVSSTPQPGGPTYLRPQVRSPYNPEAYNAAQLTETLTKQQESLRTRERALEAREKQMEVIYQDIRGERAVLDDLRKQVATETKALQDRLAAIERRASELGQQRKDTDQRLSDVEKNLTDYQGAEHDRIKQIATMYDAMPAESSAKIIQQMVDSGSVETAAKILSSMKETKAAKTLAEIADPNAVGSLMEKLRGLKKPAQPAP
jgi:chromosome segregation ATPase